MNILITGGAGFIGSHTAEALAARGHRVIIVDNFSSGNESNLPRMATFYRGDFCDAGFVENVFRAERPEIVFHFAGHINARESQERPELYIRKEAFGAMALIDIAKKYGVRKFVFASTGGIMYGDEAQRPTTEATTPRPKTPYAFAKLLTEYYLMLSGLPFTVFRYANVYGSRQNPKNEVGVIAIFMDKIARKETVVINGDGKQTRDYIFVDDIVLANIMAAETGVLGIYNIGTGQETALNDVFATVSACFGDPIRSEHRPVISDEQRYSALSSKAFHKKTGWRPRVTFEEGVRKTVEVFKTTFSNGKR